MSVKKPRIAFVSTMFGAAWGGSEALWSQAARRLLESGATEVFARVNWHPELAPPLRELEAAGATVSRAAPQRLYQRALGKFFPRSEASAYLDRALPDLVVISQGAHFDGAEWMAACAAKKIPYAPLCQCFVEGRTVSDDEIEALRQGYDRAAAAFFVSAANRRDTQRAFTAELPRSEVIFNPFNVSFDAAPSYPESLESVYRLACVARLEMPVKGHDVLFEVLSQTKWKERPLQVSLYGSGPNERTLKRLAQLYGLMEDRNRRDTIVFAGTTGDIAGVWAAHHGLILASRWEGLPLAVVEALLCGRIAIVTDAGGSAELLIEGETGFIAAAPKAELLDVALERAWERRTEWRGMGAEAARRVREIVPPDPAGVFAEKLLQLLREARP